jgi:hypothetical protein
MSDLLTEAVEAHGGLERWKKFGVLEASLSVGGGIWHFKQQPGLFDKVLFEIDLQQERVTVDGFAGNARLFFTPDRLRLETRDGTPIESRDNPRDAFAGHVGDTPWDRLHAGYFCSYALWTYLSSPFLYTRKGFETEEIDPWNEDGETWRRLKVTFPPSVASHSRVQVTHFGPDGLMRRHDYSVDVMGGATGANYTSNYREFQGIKVPTTRRVYAYDQNLKKVPEPTLVTIDIDKVTLR